MSTSNAEVEAAGARLRAVFLDYGTVSCNGDLDPAALLQVLPALELHTHTAQDDVADAIADASVVLLNKLRLTREIIAAAPSLQADPAVGDGHQQRRSRGGA